MRAFTLFSAAVITFLTLMCCQPVLAHFGMIIPSDTMVMQQDARSVKVTLSFSHPMEQVGMVLDRPKVIKVMANGQHIDLGQQLKGATVMGQPGWKIDYAIKRPGIHVFYMQPQPYWEPAEDSFIVHYTKSVVTAFGDNEGWDEEVGLKTEIVPLARPFGLYAGNVFQGVVKMDGKPVPYSTVEVEYYNRNGNVKAPTDYMVTQTIKADANGLFTYAVPAPGWWGFAALNPSADKIKYKGEAKDVELGAVIWVQFHSWPAAK